MASFHNVALSAASVFPTTGSAKFPITPFFENLDLQGDARALNERFGLIWSDRVNTAKSVGLFLSLSLLSFPEDRASSSRSSFERR
ncbi:MAG: hypothetical protein ABR971_16125, partial [Acidobacteriaceae bacterium]